MKKVNIIYAIIVLVVGILLGNIYTSNKLEKERINKITEIIKPLYKVNSVSKNGGIISVSELGKPNRIIYNVFTIGHVIKKNDTVLLATTEQAIKDNRSTIGVPQSIPNSMLNTKKISNFFYAYPNK